MNALFEQFHLEVERLEDDGNVFMLRQIDHSGNEDRRDWRGNQHQSRRNVRSGNGATGSSHRE
jgi:hypothetical protein